MATVNQIYELVNTISKQALGESAIEVVNTSTLVSLGESVISSTKNVNAWCKSLIDRIGGTLVSNKAYTAKRRKIFRNALEYGIILQKIYTDIPDAVENQSWVTTESDRKSPFELNLPNVRQYLFTGQNDFEFPVTIPDFQLKSAFSGAGAMGSFVESIMTSLANAMELAMENMDNLAVATLISKKIKGATAHPNGAVNLLDLYNTATNASLTVANCLKDREFLRFASMTINMCTKRMEKMTTVYNNSDAVNGKKVMRATSREDLVLDCLQDFATASKFYLESDTYHKDIVSLPNYTEVPYWQGSGESYAFEDVSSVFVEDETAVTGVLAVAYDINAVATTLENRYTATVRNDRGHYTNYFEQGDINYLVDLSENAVVFYVANA